MHNNPKDVVGKTALYFDSEKIPQVIRVMVTKWLGDDQFIVSDYYDMDKFYETSGWNFTIEKDSEQGTNALFLYLSHYERLK